MTQEASAFFFGKRNQKTFIRWRPNKHLMIIVGSILIAAVTTSALLAPWIATQDPLAMDPVSRLRPPSSAHWFGTDALGRDLFSRTLHGGRVSLVVGLGVAALSTILGVTFGIVAGFVRPLEGLIMRFADAMMAIPPILLAIALLTINPPGTAMIIVAIALPEIPRMVRLSRAVVLTVREQPYIDAAIVAGTRPLRLMLRHVLPNVAGPVVVQATFICALAIILEASLSFLGAGAPPEVPSWGNIIASGRSYIRNAPWIILFPGGMLALTVLSINLLGDALRDVLDPKR